MENSVMQEQSPPMQYRVEEGSVADIALLPKDLGIPETPTSEGEVDGISIKVGPLEFDYDPIRKGLEEGTTRLRLAKDSTGKIAAFTALIPGQERSTINLIWVDPARRATGLGTQMLHDSMANLPAGQIDMDVRGGKPMENLAKKMGFVQNSGGDMTNRFTFIKP